MPWSRTPTVLREALSLTDEGERCYLRSGKGNSLFKKFFFIILHVCVCVFVHVCVPPAYSCSKEQSIALDYWKWSDRQL